MTMTQKDRVLRLLRDNKTVCGNFLLGIGIARYSARIYDLRRDGHRIESRRCRQHAHQATVYEFELIRPGQGSLL